MLRVLFYLVCLIALNPSTFAFAQKPEPDKAPSQPSSYNLGPGSGRLSDTAYIGSFFYIEVCQSENGKPVSKEAPRQMSGCGPVDVLYGNRKACDEDRIRRGFPRGTCVPTSDRKKFFEYVKKQSW